MRVILDANVFLSFLIYPHKPTAVSRLVRMVIAGDVVLVFPEGVAEEMRRAVRDKPYFQERIPQTEVEELLSLISELAIKPSGETKAPIRSRDPKDQYLLDAAAGDGVEFLISGDRDLLDVERATGFPLIVTPAQFFYLEESLPGCP